MIDLNFCPNWFYGSDLIIDLVSSLVLFMIALTTWKYYRLAKNKNYFYFSMSFLFIGFSFLAKIMTNFNIYYDFVRDASPIVVNTAVSAVGGTGIFYYFGFLFYRMLMLLGLYLLYVLYQENESRSSVFLFAFFILIVSYFSKTVYSLFHLTAFMFLVFLSRYYFLKSFENNNKNTFLVGLSFAVIAVSQAAFVFMWLSHTLYAVAEIVQLVGYIILLFTFVRVLKNGKKKK